MYTVFLSWVFLHRLTSPQNALRLIVYLVASFYCFKCLVRCDISWEWFPSPGRAVQYELSQCLPIYLPPLSLHIILSAQLPFPSPGKTASLHPQGSVWCLVLSLRRYKPEVYVSLESKKFIDDQTAVLCFYSYEGSLHCLLVFFDHDNERWGHIDSTLSFLSLPVDLPSFSPHYISHKLFERFSEIVSLPESTSLPFRVSWLRAKFLRTYLFTSFLLLKALRIRSLW